MSASTPVPAGSSDFLKKARSIKGITLIAALILLLFLVFALNFAAARYNRAEEKRRNNDALVVRDVAKATQTWTPLADGMRLEVRAVDGAALPTIRRSLAFQRSEHLRADYSDVRFGNDDIPGRADLEFGTSHEQLNVRYRDIPGGGELRWITTDSVMLDSLKEWAKKVSTSPVAW